MRTDEIILSLGSAILGGLVVWIVQQVYQNSREKKKSRTTNSGTFLKKLDNNVLHILKPGVSLALSKDILGNPFRLFKEDDNIKEDKIINTNSYLYIFKNAFLKITSQDNLTIDTITLLAQDKTFEMQFLAPEFGLKSSKLNKAFINKNIAHNIEHKFIAARHDYTFAFYYSIPNPFYVDVTLYSYCKNNWHDYFETKNPDVAVNGKIFGICLSQYMSDKAFYIYQSEINN